MISARADFARRIIEIETYFDFVKLSDLSPSKIHYTELEGSAASTVISDDLKKILKANGFILLYNLIESSVIKSINAIFNKITDEGLRFSDLSEAFRVLWVKDKGTILKGVDDINFTKIRSLMRNVAESIVATEIAHLKVDCLSISGNMDAQGIRGIANQVGFAHIADGRNLVTIKNKRNQLAHGEASFCDIGKDYSVNDLITFKNEAIAFLTAMMDNVSDFIDHRRYIAQ